MPSWHERLPYSLLEGMSLGRAFVVSRVGGLQEVISDGVTGRLVLPGDVAAFGGALAALIGDPEQRSRLGAAAKAEQAASYRLDAMGQANDEIYAGFDAQAVPDETQSVSSPANLP